MKARQLIESTAADAEYLQAVEAGDTETCRSMVDAAARRAGYPVGPVFHKSPSKFTVFNTGGCEGAHFGTEDQARSLRQRGNRKAGAYYLAIQNPLRLPDLGGWSKFDNLRSHLSRKRIITDSEADEAWDAWQMSDGRGWATLKNIIRRHGFDGIVYANEVEGEGDSYIAFESSQIKSASPVVRKGVRVVPLSRRFNPASADIREAKKESTKFPTLEQVLGWSDPDYDDIASRYPDEHSDADLATMFYRDLSKRFTEAFRDGVAVAYRAIQGTLRKGHPGPFWTLNPDCASASYGPEYDSDATQTVLTGSVPRNSVDWDETFIANFQHPHEEELHVSGRVRLMPPVRQLIERAFHGTPHTIKGRFCISKVGTGEGNQSFGYGIYFTDSKVVADRYRGSAGGMNVDGKFIKTPSYSELEDGKVAGTPEIYAAKAVYSSGDSAIYDLEQSPDIYQNREAATKAAALIRDGRVTPADGNIYEVEISVAPEDLLDWDKPLSEQSEKVQAAIKAATADIWKSDKSEYNGSVVYNGLVEDLRTIDRNNAEKMASERLLAAGIPGIKYLDGFSRGVGKGTYNYVIFDPSIVKIMQRDGQPHVAESYLAERGGQKAQISQEMRDAFATAQSMAHAGHNNDYIQAVTGWYVDKYDKRLRFEVPDNEARLRPPASKSWFNAACDAQATIDKLNKEEVYDGVPRQEAAECLTKYFALFSGPFDRFENQAMSAALRQRDMSLLPEPHDLRSSGGAATLSQVLDHPKLFTAYPEITSVRIETINPESESRYRGFMRYGTGGEPATIGVVTGRGADATKRTLMHEIQHWIQDYEGFASGASVEGMARLGHELDATRERNAAKPWPDDVMARGLVAKLTDADKDKLRSAMADLAELYSTDEELLFDGMRSLGSLPPLEFEGVTAEEQLAMKRLRAKTRTARERQQSVSTKVKSPELAYHRAAGEIEARDVADRSTMDADAQKGLAPYSFENIAPEDALVMFGRGPKEWAKSIVSQ